MSRDLVEIVHDLRMQLAKRGGLSMKTLALAFHVNDRDRSGSFDFEEFETILARAGLFLKRQELTKLFRYFDRDNNERVSYNEFLRGLMGELNERRVSIIRQAFAKMDRNGNGTVEMADVLGLYDTSKHPLVISGQKTPEAVLNEFIDGFKDISTGSTPGTTGIVTWEQWVEYYRGISASIPDDDYFVFMMQQAWRITESATIGSDVPIELLQKIENVLREKIRQKSSATAPESETLRRAFKHFDLDESETVSYAEFLFALERFGILLEEKVSRALFNDFDTTKSGRISYAEFAKVLYRDDPLASTGAPVTAPQGEYKEPILSSGREDYFGDMKMFAAQRPASGAGGVAQRPPSRPLDRPQSRPPSGFGAAGAQVVARPPSRPGAVSPSAAAYGGGGGGAYVSAPVYGGGSGYGGAPAGGAATPSAYGYPAGSSGAGGAPAMARPASRPGAASPFRAVGSSVSGAR